MERAQRATRLEPVKLVATYKGRKAQRFADGNEVRRDKLSEEKRRWAALGCPCDLSSWLRRDHCARVQLSRGFVRRGWEVMQVPLGEWTPRGWQERGDPQTYQDNYSVKRATVILCALRHE